MNAVSRDPLPFNPAVLRWARERAGLAVEEAADRVGTNVPRLAEWEDPSTERQPTVKQARRLAEIYGRPFLEFFAQAVPDLPEVKLAPDYRFHRVPPSDTEARALAGVHEWAEEQRLNLIDLYGLIGEPPPSFPDSLSASIDSDVEIAATHVREVSGFSVAEQTSLKAADKRLLPDMVRSAFERCGVLILKQSGLGKVRTRGICLYAEPIPIIVLGNEAPGAQAFTLAHEFGHILLKRSAISGSPRFGRASSLSKMVEGWCNRFSAAFLIPVATLTAYIPRPEAPEATFDDVKLSELSALFAVSRHAMMIRLVNLRYVDKAYYWRVKRPQFMREEAAYEPPFMRSRYYGSRYKNTLGSLYTGLVIEAWQSGSLTGHNAAEFMGIKNLVHLDNIRSDLWR